MASIFWNLKAAWEEGNSAIFRRLWRIQITVYVVDESFLEANENILRGSLLTLISLLSNWS